MNETLSIIKNCYNDYNSLSDVPFLTAKNHVLYLIEYIDRLERGKMVDIEREKLRASLTSTAKLYDDAVRLLRAIMAEHHDASASMTEADRWLFIHVEDYQ